MLKLNITDSTHYLVTRYLVETLRHKPEGRGIDSRWFR